MLGVRAFVKDDGGYTTMAMALALLLSLTLAFGTAAAGWSLSRAADVQEVADAAAMAGENCVAAFSTVAQVLDACVLTMGLTGVVVCGAGLVVAAIPPLQARSVSIMRAGKSILQARKEFSRSAARGLKTLEDALPALIMANSASCVAANATATTSYVGMAIPFPSGSKSDYSFLEDHTNVDEMQQEATDLAEASARKQEAHERAQAAKERAWRADNVDSPLCMQSRAQTLAGLSGWLNPTYGSPDRWEFEYARVRARNYYGRRYAQESPVNTGLEELQRSAARKQFYGYAYELVGRMSCVDTDDEVSMRLEELPHNTGMVYDTRLYTDQVWPCTYEEYGTVLHCSLRCPGATGPFAGNNSLATIDAGPILRCDLCRMDARAMGNVANASTNIDNGFEHYWRIVVEASREYELARQDEIAAERDMQKAAEDGKSAFDRAMEELSVSKPKLCPPGAWGCVSVVWRPSGTEAPPTLTGSFLAGARLPAGAAISASALAPDDTTERNTVLARAFDGLRTGRDSLGLDLVGSITGLWSDLLVGYGSAYEQVQDVGGRFLNGVEGVFGERVASWLRGRLSSLVSGFGFEPADLRLRKPVLVNSQTVLDKAGLSNVGQAREVIQAFPTSPDQLVQLMRGKVIEYLGSSGPFTIAELPVPGLEGVRIPLTVDLSQLGST